MIPGIHAKNSIKFIMYTSTAIRKFISIILFQTSENGFHETLIAFPASFLHSSRPLYKEPELNLSHLYTCIPTIINIVLIKAALIIFPENNSGDHYNVR